MSESDWYRAEMEKLRREQVPLWKLPLYYFLGLAIMTALGLLATTLWLHWV